MTNDPMRESAMPPEERRQAAMACKTHRRALDLLIRLARSAQTGKPVPQHIASMLPLAIDARLAGLPGARDLEAALLRVWGMLPADIARPILKTPIKRDDPLRRGILPVEPLAE